MAMKVVLAATLASFATAGPVCGLFLQTENDGCQTWNFPVQQTCAHMFPSSDKFGALRSTDADFASSATLNALQVACLLGSRCQAAAWNWILSSDLGCGPSCRTEALQHTPSNCCGQGTFTDNDYFTNYATFSDRIYVRVFDVFSRLTRIAGNVANTLGNSHNDFGSLSDHIGTAADRGELVNFFDALTQNDFVSNNAMPSVSDFEAACLAGYTASEDFLTNTFCADGMQYVVAHLPFPPLYTAASHAFVDILNSCDGVSSSKKRAKHGKGGSEKSAEAAKKSGSSSTGALAGVGVAGMVGGGLVIGAVSKARGKKRTASAPRQATTTSLAV